MKKKSDILLHGFDIDSDYESDYIEADDYNRKEKTLRDVELYENMVFQEGKYLDSPSDLYVHDRRNIDPNKSFIRDEYNYLFEYSASSAFMAFLPVEFWGMVCQSSNTYASRNDIIGEPINIDEIMIFLGILFHMTLHDKGEYSNYWGIQRELKIFGVDVLGYDSKMTLKRFKFIRRCFSINIIPNSSVNIDDLIMIGEKDHMHHFIKFVYNRFNYRLE